MDEPNYRSINDPNGNAHPFWSDAPHVNSEEVECFRRKLKYFFMNPCEKYKARGRKPWKLILQIIKVAIITIQVSPIISWLLNLCFSLLLWFVCLFYFAQLKEEPRVIKEWK